MSSVDRRSPVVDLENESSQGSNEQQNMDKNVVTETMPDFSDGANVEGDGNPFG